MSYSAEEINREVAQALHTQRKSYNFWIFWVSIAVFLGGFYGGPILSEKLDNHHPCPERGSEVNYIIDCRTSFDDDAPAIGSFAQRALGD